MTIDDKAVAEVLDLVEREVMERLARDAAAVAPARLRLRVSSSSAPSSFARAGRSTWRGPRYGSSASLRCCTEA